MGEGGGFAGGADGDDAVGAVVGLEFDLLFEGGAVVVMVDTLRRVSVASWTASAVD